MKTENKIFIKSIRKIIVLIVLGLTISVNAQNTSVEKTIFGIQTGFAGIWINNETKLNNTIALRSEIGIEKDFTVGDHYDGTGFILQPVLTLEPRFYYNLKSRNSEGKNISKNSGNYLSIKTSYHPDWFVINLDENITKIEDLSIIPQLREVSRLRILYPYKNQNGQVNNLPVFLFLQYSFKKPIAKTSHWFL